MHTRQDQRSRFVVRSITHHNVDLALLFADAVDPRLELLLIADINFGKFRKTPCRLRAMAARKSRAPECVACGCILL